LGYHAVKGHSLLDYRHCLAGISSPITPEGYYRSNPKETELGSGSNFNPEVYDTLMTQVNVCLRYVIFEIR
jgi:hypothetical protein